MRDQLNRDLMLFKAQTLRRPGSIMFLTFVQGLVARSGRMDLLDER